MADSTFRFCPKCATPLVKKVHHEKERLLCEAPGCGFIHWGNPLPVVAAIIEHEGQVLLARGRGWPEKVYALVTGFLEAGDIDAALTTASAIGDDTLQRQATGRVVPDSFTDGSAAQRKRWFMTGYQQGTVQACNTFGSDNL